MRIPMRPMAKCVRPRSDGLTLEMVEDRGHMMPRTVRSPQLDMAIISLCSQILDDIRNGYPDTILKAINAAVERDTRAARAREFVKDRAFELEMLAGDDCSAHCYGLYLAEHFADAAYLTELICIEQFGDADSCHCLDWEIRYSTMSRRFSYTEVQRGLRSRGRWP